MPNVEFTHNSVCHYNADSITESAQSGTQVLCNKTTTVLSEQTIPKTVDVS
jgi:hypothetical protein